MELQGFEDETVARRRLKSRPPKYESRMQGSKVCTSI